MRSANAIKVYGNPGERSGGTSLPLTLVEMVFNRVVMGLRPTQGNGKRLGPASTLYRTITLSFVIPSSRLAEPRRERNDKAGTPCNVEG